MIVPEKDYVDCLGFEEYEPQIMAPRVTPLEGVSTYALRSIGVRGVENPQGFGIDERRFVASNPSHLIGSWGFSNQLVSEILMCGFVINISACGIL